MVPPNENPFINTEIGLIYEPHVRVFQVIFLQFLLYACAACDDQSINTLNIDLSFP